MGQSFRDLRIWRKGYELLMCLYKITAKYPPEEKYGLISDTRRSGNSIIANIAEAHGRYYYADKVRVLLIARGEVSEVQSHLSVAHGLGYIAADEFQKFNKEYEGIGVGINAYINEVEKGNQQNTNKT